MKLQTSADLIEFLNAVSHCQGEVLFTTTDGDRLNLKSELSRYVFLTAASDSEILSDGEVLCKADSDARILRSFMRED